MEISVVKYILGYLTIAFSLLQDAQASCAAGWINNVKVLQVKLYPSGPYLALQIDKTDGCGNWYVYKYAANGNSFDMAKAFMSLALSAQTTGTPIGLKTNAQLFGNWGYEFTDISFNKTGDAPD